MRSDVHTLPAIGGPRGGVPETPVGNQALEAWGGGEYSLAAGRPAAPVAATAPLKARGMAPPGGRSSTAMVRSLDRQPAPRPVDALLRTSADKARQLLREKFSTPPAVLVAEEGPPPPAVRPVGGRQTQGKRTAVRLGAPAAPLPLRNRIDPYAPPPPISESDAKKGVLSLQQRGLLPASVDVGPAFKEGVACVTQAPAPLHFRDPGASRREVAHAPVSGTFLTNVKLDMSVAEPDAPRPRVPRRPAGTRSPSVSPPQVRPVSVGTDLVAWDGARPDSGAMVLSPAGDEGSRLAHDVSKYSNMMQSYAVHQLIISHGRLLDTTPEFVAFKRRCRGRWGTVSHFLDCIANLMIEHDIPTAFVDGVSVADAATDELMAANPSVDTMLACISNVDQVKPVIDRHRHGLGRREDAVTSAAVAIQASMRMYSCRKHFLARKKLLRGVNSIKRAWRGYHSFRSTRALLRQRHAESAASWVALMDDFRSRWPTISKGRRVEVHIPSHSAPFDMRCVTPNRRVRENLQLARLCALRDPQVEIVYVSPFRLDDDVRSYYTKLLQTGGEDLSSRLRIVTPENVIRFPPTMSLAAVLSYSPRCLARIRHFTRGKAAYILPQVAGPEDQRVAVALGLPLLAGDPLTTNPLATKSGNKRVFTAADVNTPPGAHDLYSEAEVVPTLAALVASQLDYDRWLFKCDHGSGGLGIAYLDVGKIKTVRQLREERDHHVARNPEYWGLSEVQLEARARLEPVLAKLLPRRVVLARPDVFRTWGDFLELFAGHGGVIEASPNNLVGSPSVNLFIAPDQTVRVVSAQDQLFGVPYVYAGCSFPATSVPYAALQGASTAVAQVLAHHGVMGYIGIDFVSYINPRTGAQRVWAVDINLGLTHSASSFMLFDFVMQGMVNPATGEYYADTTASSEPEVLPTALAAPKDTPRPKFKLRNRRCFTCHEYLFHPGLATTHFPSFFGLCRSRGIAFDVSKRQGTLFLLADSLSSSTVGVMAVGAEVEDVLLGINGALSFLGDQFGARPDRREFDQEDSNFMAVLQACRLRAKAIGLDLPRGRTVPDV